MRHEIFDPLLERTDLRPRPLPDLSVVIAAKDEAGAIAGLIREIDTALAGERFEIIIVDDGSGDATAEIVRDIGRAHPHVVLFGHRVSCGQSAAIRTGVQAALGPLIVTLDGDGQNDPADIPALLARYRDAAGSVPARMIAGQRARRNDSLVKRLSSRIANRVRAGLLGDGIADTGCGLKLFEREAFLRLPYFDHMHRFLPALMQREGYRVLTHMVNHRARRTGRSKYGTWGRLRVGIVDLAGVYWLRSRFTRPEIVE
ncbi:dolichol-phosphate mannosyltransferase [Angulomicrobium tetraedrale]|uniref:Dolichol-phosphate mannosyltransferase n=1 Tax=Ancylobacter tetraedralis TaxID=217068 RepID=A0A839Z9M3_9HYPH|nr:glycosyltransferase family 2 protein [Ancylobacter tetraedralis]MBB3771397.1 dolichol-phosphate mannosyltransferase [Ancylobacter tetraedralis]